MTDLDFTAGPIGMWFVNHAMEILPVQIVSAATREECNGNQYPVYVATSGLEYYPEELYSSRKAAEDKALLTLRRQEKVLAERLALCKERIHAIERLQE